MRVCTSHQKAVLRNDFVPVSQKAVLRNKTFVPVSQKAVLRNENLYQSVRKLYLGMRVCTSQSESCTQE